MRISDFFGEVSFQRALDLAKRFDCYDTKSKTVNFELLQHKLNETIELLLAAHTADKHANQISHAAKTESLFASDPDLKSNYLPKPRSSSHHQMSEEEKASLRLFPSLIVSVLKQKASKI